MRHSGPSSAVFASVVPAVRTAPLQVPQYALEVFRPGDPNALGLVVGSGRTKKYLPHAHLGVWLDDGRYLTTVGRKRSGCEPLGAPGCTELFPAVFDPATAAVTQLPRTRPFDFLEFPGEALHRITLPLAEPTHDAPVTVLTSFAPDLSSFETLRLPTYAGSDRSISRNTGRRVFSIGSWDYVSYNDNDGEDRTASYGYLRRRVGSSHWDQVLEGRRLVALWVSQDGRALLGLQQKKGEPCGGCSKAQQIVEIDPRTAKIVGSYGVPAPYTKSWRVGQIDKVGDAVLVRYFRNTDTVPENLGTWRYDGSWSRVPGTVGPFTWWQGEHDRIEARPATGLKDVDAVPFRFVWVHGKTSTPLTGLVYGSDIAGYRGIPGSLVPPS